MEKNVGTTVGPTIPTELVYRTRKIVGTTVGTTIFSKMAAKKDYAFK